MSLFSKALKEEENSTAGAEDSKAEERRDQEEPKTAERKNFRPVRGKRKLRKMNDGVKLEVVHVSSDFSTMMLRPTGQSKSKNKKRGRLRIDGILECEGGRLDP